MSILPREHWHVLVAMGLAAVAWRCGGGMGDGGPGGGAGDGGAGADSGSGGGAGAGGCVSNPEELTLSAPDDAFSLTLPAGALPCDVDAEQVSIVELGPTEMGFQVDDEPVDTLAAFELRPDGTELRAPATLRLRASEADVPSALLHLSARGLEPLTISAVEPDEASGDIYRVVEVEHFSYVLEAELQGLFGVETVQSTTEGPVGAWVPWGFRYVVDQPTGSYSLSFPGDPASSGVRAAWEAIDGKAWEAHLGGCTHREWGLGFFGNCSSASDALLPEQLEDQGAGPAASLDLGVAFQCVDVGTDNISWSHSVNVPLTTRQRIFGQEVTEQKLQPIVYPRRVVEVTCRAPTADELQDLLTSISISLATNLSRTVDIESYAVESHDPARGTWLGGLFRPFDDGGTLPGRQPTQADAFLEQVGAILATSDQADPPAESEVLVQATLNLAEEVPLDDMEYRRIYALVADTDGNAANDWQFVEPYDWDLYRETDTRWELELVNGVQTFSKTQVAEDQSTAEASTGAFVVVNGPHINFFVPASELPPGTAAVRFTTFIDPADSPYDFDDLGADVSGGDPTEPLIPVPMPPP